MKLHYLLIYTFFLQILNPIHAFNSIERKNQIEVFTKTSSYGNILGKDAKAEIASLLNNKNIDYYNIKVTFLKGLEPLQYSQKKDKGHYYEVGFYPPTYQVLVIDDTEKEVLNKTYGKTKKSFNFGKEDNYLKDSDLSTDWRKQRKELYRQEEEKNNNINQFIILLNSNFL